VETTEIFVGPSDGTGTFEALIEADGATNIVAHWVAGGRQVVWARTVQEEVTNGATYNRPVDSEIWIINADGTNPRMLASTSSTGSEARVFSTGANGCSLDVHSPSRTLPAFVLLGMLGWLVSRHRPAPRRS